MLRKDEGLGNRIPSLWKMMATTKVTTVENSAAPAANPSRQVNQIERIGDSQDPLTVKAARNPTQMGMARGDGYVGLIPPPA